jgi:hypothetical protein
MKKLKITLFQQKDNGETQILHTQWGDEVESERKKELWDKIMSLIREHNMKVDEEEDNLKELRKKRK